MLNIFVYFSFLLFLSKAMEILFDFNFKYMHTYNNKNIKNKNIDKNI